MKQLMAKAEALTLAAGLRVQQDLASISLRRRNQRRFHVAQRLCPDPLDIQRQRYLSDRHRSRLLAAGSMINKRSGRSLTFPQRSKDYEVGYGKPPLATRFKPGQSGNPRGRRKLDKEKLPALNDERLKTIILEEAYRTISINDQNGQLDIPMAQAVVRSLAVSAAKGNQRAQTLFTQLLSSVERDNKKLHDEWFNTALDYKISWERELERRTKYGIQAPAPVPHPDDIVVDLQAGSIRVTGPMTKEEKARWDEALEHRRKAFDEVAALKALLRDQPDHPQRKEIESDIKYVEETFDALDQRLRKPTTN